MKTPAIFLIAALVSAQAAPVPLYIGTNTGGGSKSEGIYLSSFDPDTGTFGEVKVAAKYQQPGFLALHPRKPLLYSVGAPAQPFEDKSSSVAAFRITDDGTLAFLKEATAGGKGACHLVVDPSGRTLAVANYGDGSISTIRLGEDGAPEAPATVINHTGTGPNKARQERPHAHGVYFDKAGRRLFVPDLGVDKVWIYDFDPTSSKLGKETSCETPPGSGPRHLAVTSDERHAYVINELDNTVSVCTHKDGKLEIIQNLPTLPADWTGQNTTAEIEISEDGKFVYGSNRGHNSLVVFSRDPSSGRLDLVQHVPCGGKTPRHFKIAPGGKWLLCAHQDSDTIVAFPRDPATGKLGNAGKSIECPRPICLQFVAK